MEDLFALNVIYSQSVWFVTPVIRWVCTNSKKKVTKNILIIFHWVVKEDVEKACTMNTQWLDSYRIIHSKVLWWWNLLWKCLLYIFGLFIHLPTHIIYTSTSASVTKCLVWTFFYKNHRNNNHQQSFCIPFCIFKLYRGL